MYLNRCPNQKRKMNGASVKPQNKFSPVQTVKIKKKYKIKMYNDSMQYNVFKIISMHFIDCLGVRFNIKHQLALISFTLI